MSRFLGPSPDRYDDDNQGSVALLALNQLADTGAGVAGKSGSFRAATLPQKTGAGARLRLDVSAPQDRCSRRTLSRAWGNRGKASCSGKAALAAVFALGLHSAEAGTTSPRRLRHSDHWRMADRPGLRESYPLGAG